MNVTLHIPFKLFPDCMHVKGLNRSIICDLSRNKTKFIPNELHAILEKYNGSKISSILDDYDESDHETITEYFEFLFENDFIFFTETPVLFPSIELEYKTAFEITNAIIDFNNSVYDLKKVFSELENLCCKHIQLRFFSLVHIVKLENIIQMLNDQNSIIQNIQIFMPYTNENTKNNLVELVQKNGRISSVIVFNAKENEVLNVKYQGKLIFVEKNITDERSCGIIHPKNFAINVNNYIESQKYNSCLNKKISIDTKGYIKNCPSMIEHFGNIQDTKLIEALYHKDFKKYWNITKDDIEICKDCEFRHICTDCRAYRENPEDHYSKPLKCGYNPYTNKWTDWSTNPLKKQAISYYNL